MSDSLRPASDYSLEELLEDLRAYRGSQLQHLALGAVELMPAHLAIDELDLAREPGAVAIHLAAAESAVLAIVPSMTAESSRPRTMVIAGAMIPAYNRGAGSCLLESGKRDG